MPLDLKNLRQEIMKNLRVLKREGKVVWIGSDKDWSKGVKYGRGGPKMAGRPFVRVLPREGKAKRVIRKARLLEITMTKDGFECVWDPEKKRSPQKK